MMRRTILVHSAYALRSKRFALARANTVDTMVLTIEQLAARLAGGFLQPISSTALHAALDACSLEQLGELDTVAAFPGFRRALAATVTAASAAGIDLESMSRISDDASAAARFASLAELERRIAEHLPKSMVTPLVLVAAASARIRNAARLFGTVEIHGHTELAPVWRPLLFQLAEQTPVEWIAGPTYIPQWLEASKVLLRRSPAHRPKISAETCANPRHEVLEAFRWARALMTEQGVQPGEIAIAAAACDTWDDHVSALRAHADFSVFSVHGERALRTPEGQIAAALAELLLYGVSPSRCERFAVLARYVGPEKPERLRLLEETLGLGLAQAGEIGRRLLPGAALSLWNQALLSGPAQALDLSLTSLCISSAQADESPEFSVLWCSAAALASTPRAYVRLLGLTSRAWPRAMSEDALLPAHIVAPEILDPLPRHLADRRDFESILLTTAREVVCSRARRDSEGRVNGVSPLWPSAAPIVHKAAYRSPTHAATAFDRLAGRSDEYEQTPKAKSALRTWLDWNSEELTIHDGVLPPLHPIVRVALDRVQSATSLSVLLRDPLAYLWTYGFAWSCDDEIEEPLTLDARAFGELLHALLETCLNMGGVAAIDAAVLAVASDWEDKHALPPAFIWQCTVDRAMQLAKHALLNDEAHAGVTYAEVPFGESSAEEGNAPVRPWDTTQAVYLANTSVRIKGRIDRLDLALDRSSARVSDYKSGRTFPAVDSRLIGGSELQRALYASAVRVLLPSLQHIESRLVFPRAIERAKPMSYPLHDCDSVLLELRNGVETAQRMLHEGASLPNCGTPNIKAQLDPELSFALPARAADWYLARKAAALAERLAPLASVWEAK